MIEPLQPSVPLTSQCPCGSGRKYKRCCWPEEKRRASEARAATGKATAMVGAYAMSFEDELPEYDELFFGQARERFGEDELEELIDQAHDGIRVAFIDMLAADYIMRDGWTAIERLLDDEDVWHDLHPVAREYVEAWGRASMGLYEVQSVVPGESMVLKDLLARRSVEGLERTASQSLEKWDALFTRVATMGDVSVLTGPILPVPRRRLQWTIDSLKSVKEEPGDRSVTWARFFKKHWDDVPALWFLMWVNPYDGVQFVTHDGEDWRISRSSTPCPKEAATRRRPGWRAWRSCARASRTGGRGSRSATRGRCRT